MSDEKDPVRVGRFEWERLMLMSVPHPTNFKLLPLGVFMSADGGRVRPGNAGLAMFGPHEKTWAKLLRWAVTEGWLVQVARGGARRGPNGTTIVRASVYAASVPQPVWERRLEILGAPPFRAPSVEGSASDPLKGAPGDSPEGLKGAPEGSPSAPDSLKGAIETPFNSPDPSLKGATEGSLPDPLKGAIPDFEGSVSGFEGSDPSFEGSAQTLPHHVVLSSRSDSSSTSSTTVVAEDASEASSSTLETEGGGGGEIPSSEEQDNPQTRAEAFVDGLDYRGKPPGLKKRQTLAQRVADALAAGWTERGLRRYLDISDDPNVRSAAAVYEHRLSEDELPQAVAEPELPPARQTKLPPACQPCLDFSHGAATNVRMRTDHLSFHGGLCPRCHPAMVPGDWYWPGMDTADGGMWERAAARAAGRTATGSRAESHTADDYTSSSVDDLFAPRGKALTGTDATLAGWMALARQLGDSNEREFAPRPMIAAPRHQPYRNPTDQSVYDKDFGPGPAVDPSTYDEDL